MSAPNVNYGEATVMTLNKLKKKIYDNVTSHAALLRRLKSKGNMMKEDGGREIQLDIEYAENQTVKRYSGYQQLDISPSEVFTAVTFPWRQMAVAVTMSGLEGLINSGDSARYNQWGRRIDNAIKSMTNAIASDIYSDGTADGGKQIGGLQLLVPDNPLNNVGGIDANVWDFWRNGVYSFAANGVTPGQNRIQSAMNSMYLNTTRGSDRTDLIVCDNTYYSYYWESLQQIQRITSANGTAQAGFESLKFMGADVMFDGGLWGYAPPGMYFLNTDYIYFCTHKDRDFTPLDKRGSINQDAETQLITWAGNMCISNRILQGRIVS
ncbi:phage major capsid protein [Thalassobius sp. Cn5-15]|uniref:phage major capsid protein n=1 Tax=Thalassobius sp. Cn5-15 TaxID=2917763 RepID=UPI001EF28F30|nr:phage major capsid protein [Thalassobius sp. Cn5-15]MCG7492471.1 phage major capsid protein [Thalassobius sp. Cn5-15]